MHRKIYFAGSIRGGQQDVEIYRQIIEALRPYGDVLTEHVGELVDSPSGAVDSSDSWIYERDMTWLESADALVAEVSTPSHGVGYEIARAEVLGKRVLCVIRQGSTRPLSAMLAGNEKLRCETYADLAEIQSILEDFFGQP